MPESGGISDGTRKVLTLEDLIAVIERHEKTPSNVPKVDTFHFSGERVSDWLDLVEQAMVGLSDEVKFQRILKYVLHRHHQEVEKVVDAAHSSWARFREGMQRKYRLGDGLLTTADLEAMNKDDFTTIGAFVQEFKKRARKVHGISEEAQCAIFLGLLTASEASELTSHGGGSAKLTWATIDKGVEDGSLDQVEQHQMRLQRRKRKERDTTASGTPGVKTIVTDMLASLGYGQDAEAQKKVVAVVQGRGKETGVEEAMQEDYGEEEIGSQALTKAQRKQRNLLLGGQGSGKGQVPQAIAAPSTAVMTAPVSAGPSQMGPPPVYGHWVPLAWQEEELKGKEDKAMVVGDKEVEEVAAEDGTAGGAVVDGMAKGARAKVPRQAPSQAPPRKRPKLERRKEVVEVPEEEEEEDDDTEDERLRQEEDRRTEQRAQRRGAQEEAEPGPQDGLPKKRKYTVSLGQESIEDTPPVDGFLDQEEDVRLHINKWSLRVPNCVSHPIWIAPRGYEQKADLVLKPFQEEDPWEGNDVLWMMKLALAGTHGMVEEVRTIEEGPTQVEEHEQLMGGMYLLTNTLLQGDFDRERSLSPVEGEDLIPESQDDEFEEGKIKEAFRAEEYDEIYLELGLLLSCEMRDRDANAKAQKLRHLYVVTDDHLFIKRSDVLKIAMQRGERDTRPRQRPLGASGEGERHGPFRREPTPVFDDDNIELFLDAYRDHATQRGCDVSERIRHLRGIGRFEEPIAQIREEALAWPEVEARMQRLRASPVGRNGLPIRLEEGNAEEFIPAYEQYMSDQGVQREEWMQTLLIWTRGAERPLARQIRDRAHDWEDCRAQLREAFRRPEPSSPEAKVERRRRCKRLRDLEPREPIATRGGRKALAQRGGGRAGPTRAIESFPACGLRQVEFRQVTESDLRGPSPRLSEQGEGELPDAPLRNLESHLDASQWGASSVGVGPADPSEEQPTRPGVETEPHRRGKLHDVEVFMIGGDTPPRAPVPEQVRQRWPEGVPEPDSQEIPTPLPEATRSPGREVETQGPGEGWRTDPRMVIDSRLAAHAADHPDIEVPIPARPSPGPAHVEPERGTQAPAREARGVRAERVPDKAAEAKSTRIQARLAEIHERRDRMEAAGIAPTTPVDPKTSEQKIDELWARYEGRREAARQRAQETGQATERADEAIEIGELGFSATRGAIERVDRRIKQAATTSFQRYTLLSDELAVRKGEVEQLTTQLAEERAENKAWRARLEAKEAEWGKKLKEMSTAVERLSATKVVDWTEQSRYGIQGKGMQRLFGREEAGEASQQEKLGKVFLEQAEVEARREANKGSFEFKAPTELASRQEAPTLASAPMGTPAQEPQPALAEEEAAEESPTILLEVQEGTLTGAVVPPQPEAQGKESSRLDELVAAMEVDMPPERPQRLETPEDVPEMKELRTQLGSWATGTDSGGQATKRQQQEPMSQRTRATTPQASEPRESEEVVVMERTREGRPVRLDTPTYQPGGSEQRGESSAQGREERTEGPCHLPQSREVDKETEEALPSSRIKKSKKRFQRKSGWRA
ncbi:hypothetical protein CBR_g19777 [Chara braunii]|uniref:Uncharacterized protein n=1 Tax=Chara braunii TaxID=69332 RepID=A0A388JTX9_CHABU|nr:hypothetical protein CBR_g19777 [Chara braunii]|eukprot:GBG61245.1 hypothetical protein CBR_g19777 [Chara braunii]